MPVKGGQSKSNTWLIVIIILVVGAILWPLLKKNTPAGTETPENGVATTTVSVDELIVGKDNLTAAVMSVADTDTVTLRVYFGNRRFDP